MSTAQTIRLFARLRWQLLSGALRHGGAQRVAVVVGMAGAVLVGFGTGLLLFIVARTVDEPAAILVVAPAAMVAAMVALGVIAGITQPVDPRIVATEPLPDRQLAIGLLTASAFGPPGLSASFVGIGLFLGATTSLRSAIPTTLATLSFLVTLLLVSRSTINALGLFTSRFPRTGQILIGVVSLIFYGSFQLIPTLFGNIGNDGRERVADIVQWSPPGQIGKAFATADGPLSTSLGHVFLGSLWLPLLAWIFMASTRRLLVTTPNVGSGEIGEHRLGLLSRLARRACGSGTVGAIAWRSVRTRIRHPRTALETFIGAGIGMSLVLVPALTRDEIGASAVLVGGAVQLSVLFMAGNSIGSDGPALGAEILCGLEPETIVAGKARSVLVVAGPLALIGPLIAAVITGEWPYLVAGVLVGVGGLMSGTGGALVQSTFVPISVPESDNPLASGDTGNGLLAALMLAAVVIALSILTLPFALALLWAVNRESVALVSLFALATLGAGWAVLHGATRIAAQRWRRREPEIYDAVIPAS